MSDTEALLAGSADDTVAIWRFLREALRVDLDSPGGDRLATRKKHDGADLCTVLGVECVGCKLATRHGRATTPIGPHEACTEREICGAYARAAIDVPRWWRAHLRV